MYNELNRYAGASLIDDWEDDGRRKRFVSGELTIELERAHALTRSILSTSREGILSMNEDGQIEMANPAAEQMFGYPSGQLKGMNLTSLIEVPSDQSVTDFLEDAIVERISNMKKSGKDVRGKLSDATEVPLSAIFARTSTKKHVGFTCALREKAAAQPSRPELNGNGSHPSNNTETKGNSAIGTEVDEAKVDLLAGMNHQIRTPMNAVIGMMGLLLESKLTPEQREYAETVLESGENLLEIINDIRGLLKDRVVAASNSKSCEFNLSGVHGRCSGPGGRSRSGCKEPRNWLFGRWKEGHAAASWSPILRESASGGW